MKSSRTAENEYQKLDEQQIKAISRGIASVLREQVGIRFEITDDTTLDSVFKQFNFGNCADDICPLEVLQEICEFFDAEISESKWLVWLKAKQKNSRGVWEWTNEKELQKILANRTVADLAQFIGQRMDIPSFDPVVIFGNRCAPAGAFYGIKKLLPNRHFAPSSPIREYLSNNQIRKLWHQLEFWTERKPKPLVETNFWSLTSLANWIEAIGMLCACVLSLAVAYAVFIGTKDSASAFATCAVTFSISSGFGYVISKMVSDHFHNPLPPECVTFGDLARNIAAA